MHVKEYELQISSKANILKLLAAYLLILQWCQDYRWFYLLTQMLINLCILMMSCSICSILSLIIKYDNDFSWNFQTMYFVARALYYAKKLFKTLDWLPFSDSQCCKLMDSQDFDNDGIVVSFIIFDVFAWKKSLHALMEFKSYWTHIKHVVTCLHIGYYAKNLSELNVSIKKR